jgi:hypothetical protein
MSKLYQLFCDHCCWKLLTNGTDIDLVEFKIAPIPGGSPELDPVTGKTIVKKPVKSKKRYKCPNCGHLIFPKKIEDPQEKVEEQMDLGRRQQKRLENDEKERLKQLERQLKKQSWLAGNKTSLK